MDCTDVWVLWAMRSSRAFAQELMERSGMRFKSKCIGPNSSDHCLICLCIFTLIRREDVAFRFATACTWTSARAMWFVTSISFGPTRLTILATLPLAQELCCNTMFDCIRRVPEALACENISLSYLHSQNSICNQLHDTCTMLYEFMGTILTQTLTSLFTNKLIYKLIRLWHSELKMDIDQKKIPKSYCQR